MNTMNYIANIINGNAFPRMRTEEHIADMFIAVIEAEKKLTEAKEQMKAYFAEKTNNQSRWFYGSSHKVQLVVRKTYKVVSDGLTEEEREELKRLEKRRKELKSKEIKEATITLAIGNIQPIESEVE